MSHNPDNLVLDRERPDVGSGPEADGMAGDTVHASRLQIWLILSGFAMMFVASLLMWVRFGPSMFVDLATAVMNCF